MQPVVSYVKICSDTTQERRILLKTVQITKFDISSLGGATQGLHVHREEIFSLTVHGMQQSCWFVLTLVQPARLLKADTAGLYVLLLFSLFVYLFVHLFDDSCLKSTGQIRQISRGGRTMAVDNQSEISFSVSRGTWQWQRFFRPFYPQYYTEYVFSTELIRWTQAASGAAGRANVGQCRRSKFTIT